MSRKIFDSSENVDLDHRPYQWCPDENYVRYTMLCQVTALINAKKFQNNGESRWSECKSAKAVNKDVAAWGRRSVARPPKGTVLHTLPD